MHIDHRYLERKTFNKLLPFYMLYFLHSIALLDKMIKNVILWFLLTVFHGIGPGNVAQNLTKLNLATASKVSVFEVILVRIQSE